MAGGVCASLLLAACLLAGRACAMDMEMSAEGERGPGLPRLGRRLPLAAARRPRRLVHAPFALRSSCPVPVVTWGTASAAARAIIGFAALVIHPPPAGGAMAPSPASADGGMGGMQMGSGSRNMDDPCYKDPAAAACKGFERSVEGARQ